MKNALLNNIVHYIDQIYYKINFKYIIFFIFKCHVIIIIV